MTKKRVAKADLPSKACAVCQRAFTWRKKWSKAWGEVRYCSNACRGRRNSKSRSSAEPSDI